MEKGTKKIQRYVLIDTNILINCCLYNQNKEDARLLRTLRMSILRDHFILLLPEVVEIEFTRIVEKKYEHRIAQLRQFKENLDNFLKDHPYANKEIQNFLDNAKFYAGINKHIEDLQGNFERAKKTIKEIFEHKKTIRIPLNQEIVLASYRRGLRGDKPYHSPEFPRFNGIMLHSDCLIIESAAFYLRDKKDYILILCTSDKKDYLKDAKKKSERDVLDPTIDALFHNVKLPYDALHKMLNKEFGEKIKGSALSISRVVDQFSTASIICSRCFGVHGPTSFCIPCRRCGSGIATLGIATTDSFNSGLCASCQNYRKCNFCGRASWQPYLTTTMLDDGRCDICRPNVMIDKMLLR